MARNVEISAREERGVRVLSGLLALLMPILVLVGALWAFTGRDGNAPAAAATSPSTDQSVLALSEFSMLPAMISTQVGGTLLVANNGELEHNVAIEGTNLVSPWLEPGQTAVLDISALARGSYTMYCQVQGHASEGMMAMLHIG